MIRYFVERRRGREREGEGGVDGQNQTRRVGCAGQSQSSLKLPLLVNFHINLLLVLQEIILQLHPIHGQVYVPGASIRFSVWSSVLQGVAQIHRRSDVESFTIRPQSNSVKSGSILSSSVVLYSTFVMRKRLPTPCTVSPKNNSGRLLTSVFPLEAPQKRKPNRKERVPSLREYCHLVPSRSEFPNFQLTDAIPRDTSCDAGIGICS